MVMPELNIGGLIVPVPIIQGGMGVKISLSGLAAAVANEGGVGVIASVGLGDHKNFNGNYAEANAAALIVEIGKARSMSGGVIGVNAMVALTDYESLVRASVEAGADLLITGAGFCENLPEIVGDSLMKLVPITSYGRFAGKMCEAWEKYGRLPDAIVVEGPKAGGHLGFGRKKLENPEFVESALEKEVVRTIREVEKFGNIPVIAAGGIYTGEDIYKAFSWGAAGVQMGTRFVVTYECDANIKFKEEYLRARKEDIVLIDSPVGLVGRAINNEYLERIARGEGGKFGCYYHCLEKCNPQESPYCIANALTNSGAGRLSRGFAFSGANAYRCDKIIPVKELMDILKKGYSEAAASKK
ncbi:MAG: nitronate monooxygenase family protein [Nanoarchaeota archaeon]|nr:nitronate monooxygenase family protein [Nanoarchaeota archaeon]